MIGVYYLVFAVLTIYLIFLPFQAFGGVLFGAKVLEIGLFISPTIFTFDLRNIAFKLNALPFGSYVKFDDVFSDLHPFNKILICLAGLLSYLFLGVIGLGFTEPFHQTVSGFGQIVRGLWSPLVVGSAQLETLTTIILERSFLTGLGVLACKSLAFNLFPLGTLAGGTLLIYILELCGLKSEKFREKFQLFGLLFLLVFYFAYLAAFVVFLVSRFRYN